ncbi:RING finger protein 11-like isoform X2 [Ischnura elegans]|uniref:RING finger protein 11-like isoform X2 n=1 Tax=Ischnura elegans TaxID=197161 RepID=UPI001ED8673A|nr:RING finger protein 11-like isoform X2 [Ischnura elegans]
MFTQAITRNSEDMGNCLKGSTADDISLLRGGDSTRDSSSSDQLASSPPYPETAPVYYPSPNVSRTATQLTEEEQVKIAKRIGLIQHLPTGTYDGCKKNRECVICMIEFMIGDAVRYLPCMHTYHVDCIDDWLMRSFTCPSCMEPVDAALLTTYETN